MTVGAAGTCLLQGSCQQCKTTSYPGLLGDAGMEIQSAPHPLVLPASNIPMSAFFRSVSASFSTTFCFWAAISSLVFSASLQGEKQYQKETDGEQLCKPGMKGQQDRKKPTSCQHHVLTAMSNISVFSCMSTCVTSRSKEGIITPLYLALVRPHLDALYSLRPSGQGWSPVQGYCRSGVEARASRRG